MDTLTLNKIQNSLNVQNFIFNLFYFIYFLFLFLFLFFIFIFIFIFCFLGHGFSHFTWASCLSIVEIDVLTGKFDTLECHTVQDIGRSVNPSVDVNLFYFYFIYIKFIFLFLFFIFFYVF